jgi:hypothetical protein
MTHKLAPQSRQLVVCPNSPSQQKSNQFSKRLVPLVNWFSHRWFFTILRTKQPLNQCFWMVLFELQHTLYVSKVCHFDGRLHRTTYWWPLLLLLLRCSIAQGVPCTATIYALLCFPVSVLIIPDSSTTAVWQLPVQTPSSEAGEILLKTTCNRFQVAQNLKC